MIVLTNPADVGSGGFRAKQVAVVDLASEIPVLHKTNTANGRVYGGAWVLVLDQGEPLGVVEVPFHEDAVGGQELRELLEQKEVTRLPGSKVDVTRLPFASVVVPSTFDRYEQLKRCVESLSALDYPEFEVLVVDNRPNRPNGDIERKEIEEFPRVRVLEEPVRGISAARNRGIAASRGQFIAFTDDDARPRNDWLLRLGTRYVLDPTVSCVTGLVIPSELETPTQSWFEEAGCGMDRSFDRYQYSSLGADRSSISRDRFMVRRQEAESQVEHWLYMIGMFGIGCNFSFRREFLEIFGEFDCALGAGTPSRGGEDIIPMIEVLFAGKTLAYEPAAIVSHSHRATYEELRSQIFGYGVGYTAALTSLALRDPRHLIGYCRILSPAIKTLLKLSPTTRPEKSADYPSDLTRLEIQGLLWGPLAYAYSRWKVRKASSSQKAERKRSSFETP